ncbi:MAG: winged helix-turn-helix domain-containing protein [Rubrivivax sp.]|nr:winged helix-turn-helix domain-containing protein [Rubrivivax sp.]
MKLGARAFDLLALLLAERERTLARQELLERVWPGVVVEPNNLDVQVWTLRRAIGTDAIATIPGRGYRFALPVQAPPLPAAVARPVPPPATAPLARLIGRDADLAELAAGLAAGRLVTVTGAGGIGKTLLVRHLLQRLAGEGQRDTCWVELANPATMPMCCPRWPPRWACRWARATRSRRWRRPWRRCSWWWRWTMPTRCPPARWRRRRRCGHARLACRWW